MPPEGVKLALVTSGKGGPANAGSFKGSCIMGTGSKGRPEAMGRTSDVRFGKRGESLHRYYAKLARQLVDALDDPDRPMPAKAKHRLANEVVDELLAKRRAFRMAIAE